MKRRSAPTGGGAVGSATVAYGVCTTASPSVVRRTVRRAGVTTRGSVAAFAEFHTTSPFPQGSVQFVRGVMWAEQGTDTARAAALCERALVHLAEFAAANVHLGELEAARGELAAALARVERVTTASGEPEVVQQPSCVRFGTAR